MSRRNKLLIAFLVFTMAALACGGTVSPQIEAENATLEAELRVMAPIVATEAAQLPETVVQAAGQAALDNSTTLGDLGWAQIMGTLPCRDPRPVELDTTAFVLDDWAGDEYPSSGWGVINGVQCGPPTPAEAREEFLLDVSAASVAVFATPGFPGDEVFFIAKAGQSLIVVVGVGALAILADNGLSTLASLHTDQEHDPYFPGSEAEGVTVDITANWPGGPDDKEWLCFTIKLAGEIVREVFWHRAGSPAYWAAYGDLAWFDHQTGLWGGAYPHKVKETVGNLPKDLRGKGYTIESGCGNPPPFTPAH